MRSTTLAIGSAALLLGLVAITACSAASARSTGAAAEADVRLRPAAAAPPQEARSQPAGAELADLGAAVNLSWATPAGAAPPQAAADAAASAFPTVTPEILATPRPLSDKYKPGTVTIAFEGGDVSSDLGKVLLALTEKQNLLPTAETVIADGQQPCEILISSGYPGCSVELRKVLDVLNPKLMPSRGKVRNGDKIRLPDVWLHHYRTARKFSDVAKAEQSRSSTIKSNWIALNIGTLRSGGNAEVVSFNAYELILPSADPAAQERLLARVTPMKSLNVRVSSIPFVAAAAKVFAHRDPGLYQQACNTSQPPPIDYRTDYIESDGDAARIVSQRPPSSGQVRVYVVDVPLEPTPNLAGAVDGEAIPLTPGGWHCSWVSATERDHATHLASIIASQNNGYGFVGISPRSIIHPYQLIREDPTSTTGLRVMPEREAELADRIVQNSLRPGSHYVYLVATNFSDFPANEIHFGQIPREKRFDNRPLELNIREARPLVVVAAGQSSTPVELSPVVPMSPQNLGDQRTVLVVTACKSCTHNDTSLWDEANYSQTNVHVAAPGGDPMLGWVSTSGIGAMGGTSQAAAFTAGVLAEMIGRWPESYDAAENTKKRVQVTSWPLFKGNGNEDYRKLAAGIIDPNLALLDPSKLWVKDSTGWRIVKAKGFSKPQARFRSGVQVKTVDTGAIARIVQITPDGVPPRYVLYLDRYSEDQDVNLLGQVSREGPVSSEEPLSLELCGGGSLPLSDLRDLIVANSGFGDSPCAP